MSLKEVYEQLISKYSYQEKVDGWILPSGSLLLDDCLVIGGYPSGRIIEIFGPEGVGKTTLGLHALAQGQKFGDVALIDMECSLDPVYAAHVGLQGLPNEDYLHIIPDCGESAIDVLADLLDRKFKVIVIDSVAGMVPKAEYLGETGEAFMGLQARMMSQGLRKLTGRVSAAGAVVIFLNQVRSKIGVFFGSPDVTTGGRALPFYATQRIQIRSGEQIEGKGSPLGKYAKIKIIKNKMGPPLRECLIPILFGVGVDRAFEIFCILLKMGMIEQKSSFFYYNKKKIGLGRNNSVDVIRESLETWEKIYESSKNTST